MPFDARPAAVLWRAGGIPDPATPDSAFHEYAYPMGYTIPSCGGAGQALGIRSAAGRFPGAFVNPPGLAYDSY